MGNSSGWVGYFGDAHGRPSETANGHLTPEQRTELERRGDERAKARGKREVVVRVDVYENGEAVPQVQFPSDSSLAPTDRDRIAACVALAAEALERWR